MDGKWYLERPPLSYIDQICMKKMKAESSVTGTEESAQQELRMWRKLNGTSIGISNNGSGWSNAILYVSMKFTTENVGSKPLDIWETYAKDGYITRFLDPDIKSMVLELGGTNVSTTYITCPKGKTVLGITMPFLVMVVKNLKKYFSFEVTILDESGTRRRFRASNFQSCTQILPMCTVMPLGLSDGWNQIQFNLSEFTKRAYKKQFIEVQKLQINANIRLRRIYFTERLIPEDELPPSYKLFFPLSSKAAKAKKTLKGATADTGPEKVATQLKVEPPISEQGELIEEQRNESKTETVKGSKASIHSVKESASQQSVKEPKGDEVEEIAEIAEGDEETAAAEEQETGEAGGEIEKESSTQNVVADGEQAETAPTEETKAPAEDADVAEIPAEAEENA